MRPKRLLTLFLACSTIAASCMGLSCNNGPKVRVYISDPALGQMEYYDNSTKKSGSVPYSQTDKFVCFSEPDFTQLVNYCGVKQ